MENVPSYVKANGNANKCKTCNHRGVCAFSKDFEKFCDEIKEKCKLLEYQHFTADVGCGFFQRETT